MLLTVGILSRVYFGYVLIESHLYQALENRELDEILANAPPAAREANLSQPRPAPGSSIGRIEIPRLGVSAARGTAKSPITNH